MKRDWKEYNKQLVKRGEITNWWGYIFKWKHFIILFKSLSAKLKIPNLYIIRHKIKRNKKWLKIHVSIRFNK